MNFMVKWAYQKDCMKNSNKIYVNFINMIIISKCAKGKSRQPTPTSSPSRVESSTFMLCMAKIYFTCHFTYGSTLTVFKLVPYWRGWWSGDGDAVIICTHFHKIRSFLFLRLKMRQTGKRIQCCAICVWLKTTGFVNSTPTHSNTGTLK